MPQGTFFCPILGFQNRTIGQFIGQKHKLVIFCVGQNGVKIGQNRVKIGQNEG